MSKKRVKQMLSMLLVTALTLCNYACESEDELVRPQPRQEDVSANSHALSQEQAMASLQDFMKSFDGGTTRSAMHRRVKEVFPVEYYKDVTRAGADTVDCENLLYVVNFEDDQGYAILAADDRIKDAVLAVTEHCDFGWGGQHNGYYTSGVFKLNDQDAEYDHPEIGNNRKTHYNNYKRILSYD